MGCVVGTDAEVADDELTVRGAVLPHAAVRRTKLSTNRFFIVTSTVEASGKFRRAGVSVMGARPPGRPSSQCGGDARRCTAPREDKAIWGCRETPQRRFGIRKDHPCPCRCGGEDEVAAELRRLVGVLEWGGLSAGLTQSPMDREYPSQSSDLGLPADGTSMLRIRRLVLITAAAAGSFVMAGCYPVPIDPTPNPKPPPPTTSIASYGR